MCVEAHGLAMVSLSPLIKPISFLQPQRYISSNNLAVPLSCQLPLPWHLQPKVIAFSVTCLPGPSHSAPLLLCPPAPQDKVEGRHPGHQIFLFFASDNRLEGKVQFCLTWEQQAKHNLVTWDHLGACLGNKAFVSIVREPTSKQGCNCRHWEIFLKP